MRTEYAAGARRLWYRSAWKEGRGVAKASAPRPSKRAERVEGRRPWRALGKYACSRGLDRGRRGEEWPSGRHGRQRCSGAHTPRVARPSLRAYMTSRDVGPWGEHTPIPPLVCESASEEWLREKRRFLQRPGYTEDDAAGRYRWCRDSAEDCSAEVCRYKMGANSERAVMQRHGRTSGIDGGKGNGGPTFNERPPLLPGASGLRRGQGWMMSAWQSARDDIVSAPRHRGIPLSVVQLQSADTGRAARIAAFYVLRGMEERSTVCQGSKRAGRKRATGRGGTTPAVISEHAVMRSAWDAPMRPPGDSGGREGIVLRVGSPHHPRRMSISSAKLRDSGRQSVRIRKRACGEGRRQTAGDGGPLGTTRNGCAKRKAWRTWCLAQRAKPQKPKLRDRGKRGAEMEAKDTRRRLEAREENDAIGDRSSGGVLASCGSRRVAGELEQAVRRGSKSSIRAEKKTPGDWDENVQEASSRAGKWDDVEEDGGTATLRPEMVLANWKEQAAIRWNDMDSTLKERSWLLPGVSEQRMERGSIMSTWQNTGDDVVSLDRIELHVRGVTGARIVLGVVQLHKMNAGSMRYGS
ncbi:hypothetical protein C8R45DRAFT_1084060 [Mycena sanguinolenta]|nr:hypothetical protein C8R45DRAFT_1084060 [Mycena sanguinolenta]